MTSSSDRGLYERLARRFHAGVYSYLRWLCGDAELAEDLTQQTFVQIWRHPPELRGDAPLKAWVYRIARNEFLQHRRRAGLETVPLDDCVEVAADDQPAMDAQVRLERHELRAAVRSALGRLPAAYREVIVLHTLEGLTLGQVGEVLGIPKGTVKSRRAKAFTLLREMLAGTVTVSECEGSPTGAVDG